MVRGDRDPPGEALRTDSKPALRDAADVLRGVKHLLAYTAKAGPGKIPFASLEESPKSPEVRHVVVRRSQGIEMAGSGALGEARCRKYHQLRDH